MNNDKYVWDCWIHSESTRHNLFRKETGERRGFVYNDNGAWAAVTGHLLLASYQTLDQAKTAVETHLGLNK